MSDFNYYITGLVDGEGSFSISVEKDPTHRIGYRLKPSFSIGLHKENLSILEQVHKVFGCGAIQFNKNIAQFKVEDIKSLKERVLPFFEKYPLRAKKKDDFEIFKKVVLMMERKEHIGNVSVFLKILKMRSRMNAVGRNRRITDRVDKIIAEVAQSGRAQD